MKNNINHKLKNNEHPFTELFSLLKHYDKSSTGSLTYSSEELMIIQQHIDNAVSVLLQGLQGLGYLIGISAVNKKIVDELSQLGFFISLITNLTEALNDFRLDASFVLKQRNVMNF